MNNNIEIEVNKDVLKWARDTIALTRSKASENSGITIRKLEQFENGEKLPSFNELKSLSKTYKRTIATLLLKTAPKEKPLPIDRRTINSKDVNIFHEKTIMAIRKSRALVQSFIELKEEAQEPIIPFTFKATIHDSAELIAKSIRKNLFLDDVKEVKNANQALDAYIEKVEAIGVCVFQLSLTQDNLRGFSIVDERLPIIAIKRGSESTTAKIFTLFHELGHIILNEGGICDITFNPKQQHIEKWCNAFASEVLIPSEELMQLDIVKEYIGANEKIWAKKDLIHIGAFFHVGPLAILRGLLEQKLTTAEFYNQKHNVWNKPAFGRAKHLEGRNIAKETIKERGRKYINLAFRAFDQNRIGLKDLSDFLGIKPSYIPKTRQLLNSN